MDFVRKGLALLLLAPVVADADGGSFQMWSPRHLRDNNYAVDLERRLSSHSFCEESSAPRNVHFVQIMGVDFFAAEGRFMEDVGEWDDCKDADVPRRAWWRAYQWSQKQLRGPLLIMGGNRLRLARIRPNHCYLVDHSHWGYRAASVFHVADHSANRKVVIDQARVLDHFRRLVD